MKSRLFFRTISRFLGLGLILAAAGCGGKTHYQVEGQVVYKNQADVAPLAGGLVIFDPADPDMPKVSARGHIQKDGTFKMSTQSDGDGVLPGEYRVIVTPPPYYRKNRDDVIPEVIDPRFKSFATSGLKITVTDNVSDYTITVEP